MNIPKRLLFREKNSSCPESPKYIRDILFLLLTLSISVLNAFFPFPSTFKFYSSALCPVIITGSHSKAYVGSVQSLLRSAVVMRPGSPVTYPSLHVPLKTCASPIPEFSEILSTSCSFLCAYWCSQENVLGMVPITHMYFVFTV